MVRVHAEIAPVGVHDVLRKLRHLHRLENAVYGIAAQAQEVGEMLLHILGVGLAADAERVVACLVKLRAEVKQILYALAAAGDKPLHLIDILLYGAGQGRVDMRLAVGGGRYDAEVVRHHMPGDIQTKFLAGLAAATGVFLCAPFAYLVQGCFKFKASAAEA